jgi:hypothetical protein
LTSKIFSSPNVEIRDFRFPKETWISTVMWT